MERRIERRIERQKTNLALINDLRDRALAKNRIQIVAWYEQVIIKAEELLSITESNAKEMADKAKPTK